MRIRPTRLSGWKRALRPEDTGEPAGRLCASSKVCGLSAACAEEVSTGVAPRATDYRRIDLDCSSLGLGLRHIHAETKTSRYRSGRAGRITDTCEFRESGLIENPLARHYSRFRVGERLLLTGHSHQAWPDVGFEAQQRAWLDAAEFVDDKWERAAVQAAAVRAGFARLIGDSAENIALGQNTHELVTRWLSALPLRRRPRIVTTDGEFHSIRRQVDRLAEEGLIVVNVPARPAGSLVERMIPLLDSRTACVMVSTVLFESAEIVPGLDLLAGACRRHGIPLLLDAYHQVNVVPLDLRSDLNDVFVTGGGYKYCQLGEGNCFLRVPPGSHLRPVLTGWFTAFDTLEKRGKEPVVYPSGAAAFGGATYDVTSHYRAAAVFAFHERHGLTPDHLRAISRHQVGLLKTEFERLDISLSRARVEPMPDDRRGGFLVIRTADAGTIVRLLRERGVYVDARGDLLRVGPAPYLRDDQLCDAISALGEELRR